MADPSRCLEKALQLLTLAVHVAAARGGPPGAAAATAAAAAAPPSAASAVGEVAEEVADEVADPMAAVARKASEVRAHRAAAPR